MSFERRLKRSPNKELLFDELDIPVSQDHINQVVGCSKIENGIEVIHQSKWLNSVSIKIKNKINENQLDKMLECIASKDFVSSIDTVSNYKLKKTHTYNKLNKKKQHDEIYKRLNRVKLLQQVEEEDIKTNDFYGFSSLQINQTKVNILHEMGYSGRGVTILVCDTGFYKGHEALKHLKIIDEYDFINKKKNTTDPANRNATLDQNLHGTAVLSTIGSLKPGYLVGPAFGANYLLAKTEIVGTDDSRIEEDNWIAAIEWGESKGACLVQSSLSYLFYDYPQLNGKSSRFSKIVNWAISKGMVIVNSMGNKGDGIFGAPSDGDVISVGAVLDNGSYAWFSSNGPTSDGRIKPDLVAFGYGVYCADANGVNKYDHFYGTSFATPFISGIVALLMQAHPNWSSSQIKQALLKTSSQNSKPDNELGYGTVNAYEAYKYNPISENCFIGGCSGRGTCCFGKCICSPSSYGANCEYKRVECGQRCHSFNNTCQINNWGKSYNCIYKNDTSQLILNQNPNQLPICEI